MNGMVLFGAQGRGGGIIAMWDTRVVVEINYFCLEYSISCLFQYIDSDCHIFWGVSGPKIISLEVPCTTNWQWCEIITRAMRVFSNFIKDFGLVECRPTVVGRG